MSWKDTVQGLSANVQSGWGGRVRDYESDQETTKGNRQSVRFARWSECERNTLVFHTLQRMSLRSVKRHVSMNMLLKRVQLLALFVL